MIARFRPVLAALLLFTAVGCVDKPTEHRVRANAYLRAGDAEKALAECDAGLAANPGDVSLLILRGKALFELERYAPARESYTQAIEKGSSLEPRALTEAHLGLAMIAVRTNDHAEARRQFQKLVDINGRDADARLNLARVCLQLNDVDCALGNDTYEVCYGGDNMTADGGEVDDRWGESKEALEGENDL